MTHLLLYSLPPFIEEHKELIVYLLIGALAAYIAQFLIPGRGYGLLVTILIGIAGGWIGNAVFGKFLHLTHDPLFDQIICTTLGSMILVLAINLILGIPKGVKNEKDVYDWENE